MIVSSRLTQGPNHAVLSISFWCQAKIGNGELETQSFPLLAGSPTPPFAFFSTAASIPLSKLKLRTLLVDCRRRQWTGSWLGCTQKVLQALQYMDGAEKEAVARFVGSNSNSDIPPRSLFINPTSIPKPVVALRSLSSPVRSVASSQSPESR
jgi:hypothetical protein